MEFAALWAEIGKETRNQLVPDSWFETTDEKSVSWFETSSENLGSCELLDSYIETTPVKLDQLFRINYFFTNLCLLDFILDSLSKVNTRCVFTEPLKKAYKLVKENEIYVLHVNTSVHSKNAAIMTMQDRADMVYNISHYEHSPAFFHGHFAFLPFPAPKPTYINLVRRSSEYWYGGQNFRLEFRSYFQVLKLCSIIVHKK